MLFRSDSQLTMSYDEGEYRHAVSAGAKFKAEVTNWGRDYIPFVTHRTEKLDFPHSVYKYAYELLYCRPSFVDCSQTIGYFRDRDKEEEHRQAYIRLLQKDLKQGYSVLEEAYTNHFHNQSSILDQDNLEDGTPFDHGDDFNMNSFSKRPEPSARSKLKPNVNRQSTHTTQTVSSFKDRK